MRRAERRPRTSLPRILACALLAAFALAGGGRAARAQVSPKAQQEADKQSQRGADSLKRGDWRKAIDSYKKALAANPNHAEAHYGTAYAQMQLKLYDAALASYATVVRLAPNARVHDAHVYTGVTLFNLNRYAESVEAFKLAAQTGELNANTQYFNGRALLGAGRAADAIGPLRAALRADAQFQADAHYQLGLALTELGRANEASEPLQQAVRLASPATAGQLAALGRNYLLLGRDAEAVEVLRRAATLEPTRGETFVWLGQALNKLGQSQEAAVAFQVALRSQPANAEALAGLGLARVGLGQYKEALPLFEQAMQARPKDALPLVGMCKVYYGQGNYTAMLTTAQQAARLAPDSLDVQLNLSQAYAVPGQLKEAEAAARAAARIAPDSFAPRLALGFILVRLDRAQDALAEAREAARMRPDNVEAQNLLAYALNQAGQYQDALAVGLTALGLRHIPEDEGWTYYNLATAYNGMSQRDKALEAYRNALAAYQKVTRTLDPDELYLMGTAYLRLDQDEQAVAALRQSIKIRPNFAQSRYNLGLAYVAAGDRKGATEEYNALRRIDPARAAKLQALIGGGAPPRRK